MKTHLRRFFPPQVKNDSIHWSSHQLGFEGIWNSLSRPIQGRLFESDEGTVEWSCLQPQAKVDIRIGKEYRIHGFGYAEHLVMSIEPWRLPIEELRWGRFVSESDMLVWIDWRDAKPKTWVFYNGVQMESERITDREIVLEGGEITLMLEENRVLREGPLVSTAFSEIPGIQKIFPGKILQTVECKWRSRGILRNRESTMSTGWAIHEVVKLC